MANFIREESFKVNMCTRKYTEIGRLKNKYECQGQHLETCCWKHKEAFMFLVTQIMLPQTAGWEDTLQIQSIQFYLILRWGQRAPLYQNSLILHSQSPARGKLGDRHIHHSNMHPSLSHLSTPWDN